MQDANKTTRAMTATTANAKALPVKEKVVFLILFSCNYVVKFQ